MGLLLPDMHRADNVAIPKPGLLRALCASYHPITLLNEVKILVKALANRLLKVMESLVHLDQVGFMLQHFTRHTICRVQNALALSDRLPGIHALLLINFHKAFDSGWDYLFFLLAKMIYRPHYINSIRLL